MSSVYTKDKILNSIFVAYTVSNTFSFIFMRLINFQKNDLIDIETSLKAFPTASGNELIYHFVPVADMLLSVIARYFFLFLCSRWQQHRYASNAKILKPAFSALVTLFRFFLFRIHEFDLFSSLTFCWSFSIVFYGTYKDGYLESYVHFKLKNPDELCMSNKHVRNRISRYNLIDSLGPSLVSAWVVSVNDKNIEILSYQFSYLLFAIILKSLTLEYAQLNTLTRMTFFRPYFSPSLIFRFTKFKNGREFS